MRYADFDICWYELADNLIDSWMRAYRERLVFKSIEDSQQLLNFLSNFGRFKRYFQSDHPPPAAVVLPGPFTRSHFNFFKNFLPKNRKSKKKKS